ncbi:MAG: amidohydrolase family protein [Clostridia bacterium]|nr:amidohydrolase family protein [Clostridia bacterium]
MNTPKIFDAHCHIFPLKIAEKATVSIGSFYDIPMARVGSPEMLREEADALGLVGCLVCSTATKAEQTHAINDFIHAAVMAADGFFYGFGTLHQDLSENELCAEIDRMVEMGLHGIKLHPDFQKLNIDDPRMLPAYHYAAEKGLPILFHMGDDRYDYSSPARLLRVTKEVPDLLCMAAHLGGYHAWKEARVLRNCENVIFDCSSSLEMLSPEEARTQMNILGYDRILFGSDFPMWRPADVVKLVQKLNLGSDREEKIFYQNAKRWLHIQ